MKKINIIKEILKKDFPFNGDFCMDSRLLKKGDVFLAINKGNEYVKKASELGAFVIYDDKTIKVDNSILVDDTVLFMQKIAREYREKIDTKIIAITGSNGKTTTKDILAGLLSANKTLGNHNNHIGMPYTLLNCPSDSKYLVLELGMSNPKEIDLLSSICKPDYSIIVNIGISHLKFLSNRENIFEAKKEIIRHTKNITVVNDEDDLLSTIKGDNISKVRIENALVDDYGTSFIFENDKYHINLFGRHNALNAALCIKILKLLNEKVDSEKLNNIKLTSMRFEIIPKDSNIYINDAYNSAPKAVEQSLLTLDKIFKDKNKVIILGDMLELGDEEIKYHKDLKTILDKIKYNKLYLFGDLMSNIEIEAIKTKDINKIISDLENLENSVIFFKGSRGMKLERILKGE